MNVTLVTASTGGGHNSTTKALSDYFGQAGVNTSILDMYRCCGTVTSRVMEKGYLFASKRMRRSYRGVYGMLERSGSVRRAASAAARQKHVSECVYGAMPDSDVIVTVHPFAAHAVDLLKKRGLLQVPVLALVTDYCVQPFIEDSTSLEAINFASPLLLDEASDKGITNACALGLPVRREFLQSLSRDDARSVLGLDQELPTVFVMGGSMGYGDLYGTVEGLLSRGIQVICICGQNDSALHRIKKLSGPLLALGYSDQVSVCMDAADLIITKPGGITVTELISKKLPAVLSPSIPGQEERNGEFLIRNGGAVRPAPEQVVPVAAELLTRPDKLAAMSECLAALAMPNAGEDICRLAERLAKSRIIQSLTQ